MRRNLNIPISCKIRSLDTAQDTVEYARQMEKAGAMAIGIHARYISERPSDRADWNRIALVPSSLNIPVLANGDIFRRHDIERVKKITGCSSVLIARGALWNASIFCQETLPLTKVITDYYGIAMRLQNHFQNTKYNVARMIGGQGQFPTDPLFVTPWTIATMNATKGVTEMGRLLDAMDIVTETLPIWSISRSSEVPARVYDDAFVEKQVYYCHLCSVSTGGPADLESHKKGKKHRKKVHRQHHGGVDENSADVKRIRLSSTTTDNEKNENSIEANLPEKGAVDV